MVADANCQHHEDVVNLAAVDQQLEEDTIFATHLFDHSQLNWILKQSQLRH